MWVTSGEGSSEPSTRQVEDFPLLVERAGIGGDDPPLALEEGVQIEAGVAALRRMREEHDGAAGARELDARD